MGKQCRLDQHPLATALDKLVKHEAYISQGEAADVEAEELGCMPCAQLQADVGRRGVLEPGVLDLLGDLIWKWSVGSVDDIL